MRLRTIRHLREGTVTPREPKRLRTVGDLSPDMRRALLHYATAPVPTTTFGSAPDPDYPDRMKPIAQATLDALLLADLVCIAVTKKGEDVWAPTDAARELCSAHVPWLLAAASHRLYVHDPERGAMRDEPEAVDPAEIDRGWTARARERFSSSRGGRERAAGLKRNGRA